MLDLFDLSDEAETYAATVFRKIQVTYGSDRSNGCQ
jgi:hypothetical protein